MPIVSRVMRAAIALSAIIACLTPRVAESQIRRTAQFTPGANRMRVVENDALPQFIEALPDVNANMKVIRRRSQLMITRSNVVRIAIADQRIIDTVQFSPTEMAVVGMSIGSTTMTLWFEDSPHPLIYLVEVINDPVVEDRRNLDYGRLEEKLADLFPASKVYLIPMHRKLIVKGQARNPEEVSQILQIIAGEVVNQNGDLFGPGSNGVGGGAGVGTGLNGLAYDSNINFGLGSNGLLSSYIVNMLTVPGENQITLRVRIAELKRSMLRQMGVNFSTIINDGSQFFASAISGGSGTLTGIFSSGDVSVLINALELNGTAKVLAEPNITVLSGHPASFLSGGEFAVPTIVGINGVGGQQTNFRGYGVSLVVVPTLQDRDLIRMQILPEFSAIDQSISVGGVPGTNTRRVTTTVELREGQTIALAGLLSHQSSTKVQRIPVIGQIPIIGPLIFSDKNASMDESELLILVTPEIIRPMDPDEVPPVPGFEVTHPNNCELYWSAMTEGAPDKSVNRQYPLGRGTGNGIPVGYPAYNLGPGVGYAAPNNPLNTNQAPLTNGSLQGSPYDVPAGQTPLLDSEQRDGNSAFRSNGVRRNDSGVSPQEGARLNRRYDGHAPGGLSSENGVQQAGYRAKRKPLIKRADATDENDRRNFR